MFRNDGDVIVSTDVAVIYRIVYSCLRRDLVAGKRLVHKAIMLVRSALVLCTVAPVSAGRCVCIHGVVTNNT